MDHILAPRYASRNSAALRHKNIQAYPIHHMRTVDEVRRLRLLQLKEKFGGFVLINEKMDFKAGARDSTLSQITNQSIGSKTSKPKTMGTELARRIERVLELPEGYMDTDPDAWPFPGLEEARFRALPDEQRIEIQGKVRELVTMFENQNAPKVRTYEPPKLLPSVDKKHKVKR